MNIDLFGIEDTLTLQRMDSVIAEYEAKIRYVKAIRDRCVGLSIKQEEKLLLYRDFLLFLNSGTYGPRRGPTHVVGGLVLPPHHVSAGF